MQVLTLVFAGVAAIIHVYIFILESVRWDRPSTRSAFGVRTDEEAAATRPLAFNQGFYNLFLALMAALGIGLVAAGSSVIGSTLIFASTGSMVAAGLVLWISNPPHDAGGPDPAHRPTTGHHLWIVRIPGVSAGQSSQPPDIHPVCLARSTARPLPLNPGNHPGSHVVDSATA